MTVDAGCDDTCPLASIGLVLSHLLVKIQPEKENDVKETYRSRTMQHANVEIP